MISTKVQAKIELVLVKPGIVVKLACKTVVAQIRARYIAVFSSILCKGIVSARVSCCCQLNQLFSLVAQSALWEYDVAMINIYFKNCVA